MPLEARQREPPVVMHDRILRREPERVVEARERLGLAAEREQLGPAVAVQRRLVRLQREGALDARERFGVASRGRLDQAEVVVRLGVAWIERERTLEAAPRLVGAVEALQGHARAVLRLIIVRSEPGRLPETHQRCCRFAHAHERHAAAAMRPGKIGLQGERAVIAGERLSVTPGCTQGAAEIRLYGGIGRLQLRGCLDQAHRLLRLPESRQGAAEQLQCIGIARLAGEHLAVQRHGLGEAALVVGSPRPREHRATIGHGRLCCRARQAGLPGSVARDRRASPSTAQARARSYATDRCFRNKVAGGPAPS